ncbi:MAG: hypothetical protein WC729_04215 [Sphingomonas sp.]|jgi:hypothetical protein|uniref:hypothetical protein n=1 Tax=Sphingomonas sp. TaxID=28214 RepID=UPI003568C1DA
MSEQRNDGLLGVGLRALKGGAVVVALAVDQDEPRILLSTFLATHDAGDRLSLEPYGVAAGMPRGPDGKASAEAAAAVAQGRARQDRLATRGLQDIVQQLGRPERDKLIAALVVNRAGWVTDLLDYSLAWADHVPVAEGLAVREALRFGVQRCRIDMIELDEKSLPDLVEKTLGLSSTEVASRLKDLGAAAGRPWRKEQKAACLAAWIGSVSAFQI